MKNAFILLSRTELYDQVRMLRLCATDGTNSTDDLAGISAETNCSFPLNSSVLIHSFTQHITMD